MSILRYNNLELSYALTISHEMGPVTDDSHTDQTLTSIRIACSSIITPGLLPAIAGESDPAAILTRIRHLLTQPRAPIYYALDTNQAVVNLPGGRDDANGPWPDERAITVQYTTPDTILVTFSVEVRIKDCGTQNPSAPLSIRWEDSFSMDERFRARWDRRGTAILSSRSTFTADYMRRNWIAPVVAPGFARTGASYTLSRDGLRVDFQFVDEQIRWAPPYPATNMTIVQSESTTESGQGMRFGSVVVDLEGSIGADPTDLLRIAARVAVARIAAAKPQLILNGTVFGKTEVKTQEDRDSVRLTLARSYRIVPTTAASSANTEGINWGRLSVLTTAAGGAGAAFALGSEVGERAFGTKRELENTTQQGQPAASTPINFDWIGYGTSAGTPATRRAYPAGPNKPAGFADWAQPSGQINTFPDGDTPLAQAVGLWAAALRDPCGTALANTPSASFGTTTQAPTIKTTVSLTNSSAAGNTGQPYITTAAITAAYTNLASSEYPTTIGDNDVPTQYTAELAPGHYTTWQCLNEYSYDTGNVVVPVCSPTGTNVAIQHSSRLPILRKRWVAEREGSPPLLPAIDVGDNWVLIDEERGLRENRKAEDGQTWVYRCEGVYVYAALDPSTTRTVEFADSAPFIVPKGMTSPIRGWTNNLEKRLLDATNTSFGGTSQLKPAPTIGYGPPAAGVYDAPTTYTQSSPGINPGTTGTQPTPVPGGSTPPGGSGGGGPLGSNIPSGPGPSGSLAFPAPMLGFPLPGFIGSAGSGSSGGLTGGTVGGVVAGGIAGVFGGLSGGGQASPLGTDPPRGPGNIEPSPLPPP